MIYQILNKVQIVPEIKRIVNHFHAEQVSEFLKLYSFSAVSSIKQQVCVVPRLPFHVVHIGQKYSEREAVFVGNRRVFKNHFCRREVKCA